MSMNAMADIALGLILMYLVLSLICTVINENISGICKLRSKTLGDAISKIVDNQSLLDEFNKHGLISGIKKVLGDNNPSYISGATFATALLDSLSADKPILTIQDVSTAINSDKFKDTNIKDIVLAALPTNSTATAAATAASTSGTTVAAPAAAAGAAPAASPDLDAMRNKLAIWFDGAMERVSGKYKRDLGLISFLVGVAVAVILNADSWDVASALWSDANLRSQMAGVATDVYKTGLPAQAAAAKDKDPMTVLNEGVAKVKDLQDKLSPLPIGWSEATIQSQYDVKNPCLGLLAKWLGWLFTAIAITLGAPFWFDLLSKFIQIRNSGDQPKPTKPATAT